MNSSGWRWGGGCCWSFFLNSYLITRDSQCSVVQREGRNGSHPPSIITGHVSAIFVSSPPPLFITHRSGAEVRFQLNDCVYLPGQQAGWQSHGRWRCRAVKLHFHAGHLNGAFLFNNELCWDLRNVTINLSIAFVSIDINYPIQSPKTKKFLLNHSNTCQENNKKQIISHHNVIK